MNSMDNISLDENIQANFHRNQPQSNIIKPSYNLLGELKYNIEEIMTVLESKCSKEIIYEISKLFKEAKKNLLEMIFTKIGKKYFLSLVEKTLKIQNEGGMKVTIKRKDTEETLTKSSGGVFFSLVKSDGIISKEDLKLIFKSDKKMTKEKNKVIREMSRLLLSE